MSRPSAISVHASQVPQGSGVGPVHAVQRPSQDAGGRGLSHTARTGEHEGLREPVVRQGVAQRLRHAALADDVRKRLWAILAREHLVGHVDCRTSPRDAEPVC